MKILAIDTSSKAASCAVLDANLLLGEFYINIATTHSQTSLPMVEALLAMINTSLEAIDIFAVSVGPGSFTGLRIGISSVKGIAMALNKPCVGVSTIYGLAHNLSSVKGLIIPCMDARRNLIYTGMYRSNGGSLTPLVEDCNIPIVGLLPLIREYQQKNEPVYLLGDGALLTYDTIYQEIPCLQIAPPQLLHQRASSIALAAKELVAANGTIPPEQLEPLYLRMVQAERERLENQQ